MLLNANEKIRLLRLTPGADTDDVVEELFAMAGDTQRQEFPNGIDVTPDDLLQPPIIADFPDDGQDYPVFQARRGDDVFSINLKSGGFSMDFNPADSPAGDPQQQRPMSFPGRVMSYQGNNKYIVKVFKSGLTTANGNALPGVDVLVTQLEGDPAFPQTADGTRWAFVVKAGAHHYMLMPVWG